MKIKFVVGKDVMCIEVKFEIKFYRRVSRRRSRMEIEDLCVCVFDDDDGDDNYDDED